MLNIIGFKALLKREILRFMVIYIETLLTPLISTTLFLVIFGNALGGFVEKINGTPYINFLIPGLIIMVVIETSYSNTAFSLFFSRFRNYVQEILVSPLSYFEMVSALTLGGIVRGVIVGIEVYIVSLFFSITTIHNIFLLIFFLVFISLIFSSFGLIIGLWAEEFEHLTIWTTFVITPLIFIGGTFYSVKIVPEFLKNVTLFNPFFYMIDGFRYSFIGVSEGNLLISIFLVLFLAVAMFLFTVHLFKKGYKLRA